MKDEIGDLVGDLAEKKGFERNHRFKWSVDRLLEDVATVSSINAATPEGYPLRWNSRQKVLVSIYRRERMRLEASKRKERARKKPTAEG